MTWTGTKRRIRKKLLRWLEGGEIVCRMHDDETGVSIKAYVRDVWQRKVTGVAPYWARLERKVARAYRERGR